MSLYLKYRPQDFKTVVGQKHAITTIQNALKARSLTHAYLFCGPRGTGKTSLARIMGKALNCLNPCADAEPCNACDICEAINKGRLVDFIEIDAASNRGIDEIRELREKIVFAPSQAKTKIYIIDEVHMLTKEAFNALLKTLEEPPSHAYFVLATTEAHKIPETIISRCQQFNFKRIESSDIIRRLQEIAKQEGVRADQEALSLIAKVSNGGLRDAIGLFEQMITDGGVAYDQVVENLGLSDTLYIEKFVQSLIAKKALKAVESLQQINAQGRDLIQFSGEVIAFLREQMLINLDHPKEVKNIIYLIDVFSEAKQQIAQAVVPELPLEVAIVKACHFELEQAPAQPTVKEVKKESAEVRETTPARQESAPQKASPPSASSESEEITFELIKKKWQQILDNVETPFVRMSLMDGEPSSYEAGVLKLKFNSSTLMQKVESTANQEVVLKALKNVLGSKITLHMEVKKITLTPAKTEDKNPAKESPSVVEMAKEVFGVN